MSDKDLPKILPMDDDVTSFPADEARMRTFQDASDALSRFEVPQLVDPANPHEKLFIAAFDGTGNDADKDPIHKTNIGRIRDQIQRPGISDDQIYVRYLAGPGTQDAYLERTADLALGHTYEARLEEMYGDLVNKAFEWRQADPNVQIRVLSTGFSRGGSQAAGFTNLLHERGIVDLDSEISGPDGRSIYARQIAAPGQTPQAVGLFDPVATGLPETYDRRLAPSVVSGFQITAMDEQRVKFISDRIMPMGLSEDGRFLNVAVAGAHSDVGGSYIRDGLSSRSFNIMSDYLNAQRPDAPMLEKVFEPTDPRLNVVHNSHEGMTLYQLDRRVSRSTPEGVNTRLAPDQPTVPGQITTQEALPHSPHPAAPQIARGPMTPARIGPLPELPSEVAIANVERIARAEAAGIGPLPGSTRLAHTLTRSAGVLAGAGLTAYEGVETARRASALMEQGNTSAAQSEVNHAVARNAGGWIGGGVAAYAVGASGFVPAAIVAGDALLMSKAFEHGADLLDNHRIFHQTDKAGVEWQFTGRNWERQTAIDRTQDGRSNPVEQNVVASYAKSQELGAMANAKAVELALGKAPPPQDPFNLPAEASDLRGLDNQNWQRNPSTESWERQVKVSVSGENNRGSYETGTAPPERAQQLNQEALGRIEGNIANGREAIAAVYLANHAAMRGQDYGVGVPAAVEAAKAKLDQVQGHDGQTYQRNPEGHWAGKDGVASGNLAVELELTSQMREPSLERSQEDLAAIQARPAPTAAQTEQNELLHRYRAAGVDLSVKPGAIEAVERASQQTLLAAGIQGTTLNQLQRNEAGQYGYDSPIVHYQAGADGVAHQVAVTQPGDIRQALAEVRQQQAPSTATLATVTVTAPKLGHPAREQETTLAQDDQAQRQAPAPQASAPVTPDFQHDHALLQEREQERQQPRQPEPTTASPPNPQASFLDPSHAGHQAYKTLLNGVHTMEFDQGIKPGPHSEKVAAALLIEGVANGLHPNRVKMGADGQVQGIQQFSAFDKPQSVSVDPKQAQGLSMQQYAEKMEATLSSHLVSHAPAAERTTEQKQGIAAMSMNDQILFAHLRRGTPGHISDDHVAQVMLDAKQSGIDDASKIASMTMAGDKLCVMGAGPGQRAVADVSQQAPALQETVQQVQAVNQQREQQLALEMQPKPEVPKGHMV